MRPSSYLAHNEAAARTTAHKGTRQRGSVLAQVDNETAAALPRVGVLNLLKEKPYVVQVPHDLDWPLDQRSCLRLMIL